MEEFLITKKNVFVLLKLIKRLFASLFFIAHWWTLDFFLSNVSLQKVFMNISRIPDVTLGDSRTVIFLANNGELKLINSWRIRVFPDTLV